MADPVSICNMALAHLGDTASIATLDAPDNEPQAKMCAIFYPQSVLAVLDMHDWSFAAKRRSLTELADEDSYEWLHVFQIPSDCLHVISLREARARNPYGLPQNFAFGGDLLFSSVTFSVIGDRLYTDVEVPELFYISSETKPNRFSPAFVTALSYYLASLVAGARIKGKEGAQLAQNMQQEFAKALSIAKTRDAFQRKDAIRYTPTWIQRR